MKMISKLQRLLSSKRNRVLAVFISITAMVAVLLLFEKIVRIAVLVGLMAVAVLPTVYRRWVRIAIGVEFMVFATVIVGVNYGALVGAVFGVLAMVISDIITRSIGEWTILNSIAIAVGGIIAGMLGNWNSILVTGLVAVISVELIRTIPPLLFGAGEEKAISIFYVVTHILFNIWLFFTVSRLFSI